MLILSLLIVLFHGCRNTGNDKKFTNFNSPLHFNITKSRANEPIALLNIKGTYHLFYTTFKESDLNNTSSIGHSISSDLLHWREISKSVFSEYKNLILRGTIVFDSKNITGYGTIEYPPLIAVFASSNKSESKFEKITIGKPVLAFSIDNGESWKVILENIDLPDSFGKNPQNAGISWFEPTRKWIMSVTLNDHVEFYSSADLKIWNFESLIGADFFPEEIKWKRSALFSAGDDIHWILLADIKKSGKIQGSGGTVYFVGYFDGHNFINQSSQLHWLDYGQDIYGSLISIGDDGRRINIGWRNRIDEIPQKTRGNITGIVTLPREISKVLNLMIRKK